MHPHLNLGDIIEIKTARGFAYAQYVNHKPKYGPLMRILPGTFPQRLKHFEQIVRERGSYCCFWNPKSALAKRTVKLVGNLAIPSEYLKMPTFKWGLASITTGRVAEWSIWNGSDQRRGFLGSRPVRRLTRAQKRYPIDELVPLEYVVARIERGWRPEDACRG